MSDWSAEVIDAQLLVCFGFFKKKTAYELRISDWSSDACSSDLGRAAGAAAAARGELIRAFYSFVMPDLSRHPRPNRRHRSGGLDPGTSTGRRKISAAYSERNPCGYALPSRIATTDCVMWPITAMRSTRRSSPRVWEIARGELYR